MVWGFSFGYLHQLETITTIDLEYHDENNEEDLFLLPVRNSSVEMMYELLKKDRFGTVTESEKAQLSIQERREHHRWWEYCSYINWLQHLMPSDYSGKGQN